MKSSVAIASLMIVMGSVAPACSATRDTTLTNTKPGFAFDMPRGFEVDHPAGGDWFTILDDHSPVLDVTPEGYEFSLPMSDPQDTVLSYVKFMATRYCDLVGPYSETGVDSILSVRRSINARGFEVFEVLLRVVTDYSAGGANDDTTVDSSAAAALEELTTEPYMTGSIFAVKLSRSGRGLWVWVRPECYPGRVEHAEALSRIICRSMRRLEPEKGGGAAPHRRK